MALTHTGDITGNAATVTTNANLTGDVTSVGNATTFGAGKTINALTLAPGSELVTNGTAWTGATGATPPTGWTVGNAGTFTIDSSSGSGAEPALKIEVNGTPTEDPYISQSITTVVGHTYELSVRAKRISGSSRIYIGTSPATSAYYSVTPSTSWQNERKTFTATTTTTYITLYIVSAVAGQNTEFDTVSLKEVAQSSTGPQVYAAGSTGGWVAKVAEATATPSGTTTFFDILVNVPSGARIKGVQLRVDTALTAGETWGAAYVTGSTTTIAAAGQAVAQNTKINLQHVDEITSGVTNVRITRDAGNFTDGAGVIRAIVYYEELVAMGSL